MHYVSPIEMFAMFGRAHFAILYHGGHSREMSCEFVIVHWLDPERRWEHCVFAFWSTVFQCCVKLPFAAERGDESFRGGSYLLLEC